MGCGMMNRISEADHSQHFCSDCVRYDDISCIKDCIVAGECAWQQIEKSWLQQYIDKHIDEPWFQDELRRIAAKERSE